MAEMRGLVKKRCGCSAGFSINVKVTVTSLIPGHSLHKPSSPPLKLLDHYIKHLNSGIFTIYFRFWFSLEIFLIEERMK